MQRTYLAFGWRFLVEGCESSRDFVVFRVLLEIGLVGEEDTKCTGGDFSSRCCGSVGAGSVAFRHNLVECTLVPCSSSAEDDLKRNADVDFVKVATWKVGRFQFFYLTRIMLSHFSQVIKQIVIQAMQFVSLTVTNETRS